MSRFCGLLNKSQGALCSEVLGALGGYEFEGETCSKASENSQRVCSVQGGSSHWSGGQAIYLEKHSLR